MGEPIKKPGQAPESYQPKMPEIIGMVEKARATPISGKPYAVKTANDGSYIDGVSTLEWGKWRDKHLTFALTWIAI